MQRVNLILTDKTFITRMKEIEEAEKDRIFCKHGYEHIIDVARLSYILYLENRLKNKDAEIIDKALIYAAAILHDIGRFSEFDKFLSHGEAGSVIARGILENACFDPEEREIICDAIRKHSEVPRDPDSLTGLLYRADKMSRNCFDCKAFDACNWPDEKRNHFLVI